MKFTENFYNKRETKEEKEKTSWLLKIPLCRKISESFSERDRCALKWLGIILLILIFSSLLYEIKLYWEKNVTISIGVNQSRYDIQNLNTREYFLGVPQYSLSINNKNNLMEMMVITQSEINDTMICCKLDANQTQFFQTEGETGYRDNLFVYLRDWDTLEPATLRDSTEFLLGIEKRKIINGISIEPSGVVSLYYLRFTDTLHFSHDYLIITYALYNQQGQSLYLDQAALSFDYLKKEAQLKNEAFSLKNTLSNMAYLDGLLNWANRFDSVYPALQTTPPTDHPMTLRNLVVAGGSGYVLNSQAREQLEQSIVAFAETAKNYADNYNK